MGRHARSIRVKRMDCSVLGTLVINHEPIELIDVRSKNEFGAMHIPGCRITPLWRTGGARDLSKTASDETACLGYCCRRSRAGQPCDREIAISRLCERRSGGWRNEGLGCPRVPSAPEEDRCQRSGLSRARGGGRYSSGRGGGVA